METAFTRNIRKKVVFIIQEERLPLSKWSLHATTVLIFKPVLDVTSCLLENGIKDAHEILEIIMHATSPSSTGAAR
jgi:hypothetical protein